MVYTEFISADGLIRDGGKSIVKLDIYDNERPVGIQIYGNDSLSAYGGGRHTCRGRLTELIDINFGCPVKKIAGRGAGSGMMRNVPLMVEITGP